MKYVIALTLESKVQLYQCEDLDAVEKLYGEMLKDGNAREQIVVYQLLEYYSQLLIT